MHLQTALTTVSYYPAKMAQIRVTNLIKIASCSNNASIMNRWLGAMTQFMSRGNFRYTSPLLGGLYSLIMLPSCDSKLSQKGNKMKYRGEDMGSVIEDFRQTARKGTGNDKLYLALLR